MVVRIIKGGAKDHGYILEGNKHITMRELETLMLIAMGFDNSSAARKLGVSVNTVRNHIANISQKMGARSRAHAVMKAIENEMLRVETDKSLVGLGPDDYLVCFVCNRAFSFDEVKTINHEPLIINHVTYEGLVEQLCPYAGCGWSVGDSISWDKILEHYPGYPRTPVKDVVYEIDEAMKAEHPVEYGFMHEGEDISNREGEVKE